MKSEFQIIQNHAMEKFNPLEEKELIMESLAELEEMYKNGEMEQSAYFIKKRALIKQL